MTVAPWAAVAAVLVDGVFDAADRAAAVDHILTTLEPVRCREDVMSLGRELSALRTRTDGRERQIACSALAQCLYRSNVPMQPPLATGLGAVVAFVAICGAVVAGQPVIAFVLAPVLIAALARIGTFVIRSRRADPTDPARLPDASQLLALRCVRSLPAPGAVPPH